MRPSFIFFLDQFTIKRNSLSILCFIFILFSLSANADREGTNASRYTRLSTSTSPPNIVVVLVDDAGYDDFGFQNINTISTTPNIDLLANEGTIFTQAYVTNGLCSPSRAGILSGRYNSDVGFQYNIASGIGDSSAAPGHTYADIGLDPSVPTMGNYLQDLGYETALFGKWHLGYGGQTQHLPNNRGFDFFYGLLGGSRPYDAVTTDDHKKIRRDNVLEEPTNNNFFLTDLLTDTALTYMTQQINKNTPFLAFMSYTAPHGPYTAKPADYAYFDNLNTAQNLGLSENNKHYYGLLKNVDDNVKRIVDLLKLNNEYDNTLFIFLSDNGGVTSKAGNNGDLNGEKGSTLEGGLRVPFFMTWKNAVPSNGVYNEQVISLDLTTTFIEAAGGNLSDNEYFDLEGEDLVSAANNTGIAIHDKLYWRKGIGGGAVSDGINKVRFTQLDSFQTSAPILYNLDTDLSETTNIYASNTSTALPLIDDWNNWRGTIDLPSYIPEGVVESECGVGVPINSCTFLTNYYSSFNAYTALTQIANSQLTVSQNTVAIGQADLEYKDSIKSEGEITYVLTQLPAHGTITKSGQALAVGESFKQIDINTGDITYNYGGTPAGYDVMLFDVNDGSGGETISNVSFTFSLLGLDSDGDGIADKDDLDDDNDGILDTDEYNFSKVINVKPGDMGLTASQGNNGTDIDISSKFGLPTGTVTVTYSDVDATLTSNGSLIFNQVTDSPSGHFSITSTYPLKFRPGLGNSFNTVGDKRGFTSNDGMTYNFTSPLNSGYSHTVNSNTYTVERISSGSGVASTQKNLIWMGNEVTTSFDISYNAFGSGANYRLTFFVPEDTDGDNTPDYLDLDSDNDGIADIIEAGGIDANGDGEVDYPTPGDPTSMLDTNNNGWSSVFDDGSADASTSENGIPLADADSDTDTYQDRIDIDSDNDGIVDVIEGQSTLSYVAPLGTDTDSDGIDDAFDTDYAGAGAVKGNLITFLSDVDGDGTPDYLDDNSDDDVQTDQEESGVSAATNINDSDVDGLIDAYDADANTTVNNGGATNNGQTPTSFVMTSGSIFDRDWRDNPNVIVWTGSNWIHGRNYDGSPAGDETAMSSIRVLAGSNGIINDDVRILNLIIDEDAVLEVNACLTVTTSASNSGLMCLTATNDTNYGTYHGPAIIQTEFQMIMEKGWHNIGFPLSNATVSTFDSENDDAVVNITNDPATHNLWWYDSEQSGGEELGFTRGAYNTHAYGTWKMASNENLNAHGYNFYIDENFASNLPKKIKVTGTTNDGDVNFNTDDNWGGWNLIPNIYPISIGANIMFTQGFFGTEFDNAVWLWNPHDTYVQQGQGTSGSGSYVAIDAENGSATGVDIDPSGQVTVADINIAPMQAFYIRRSNGSEVRRPNYADDPTNGVAPSTDVDNAITSTNNISVTVKPEFRTDCLNDRHYKTNANAATMMLAVYDVKDHKLNNAASLVFADHYTNGYDKGFDIPMMSGGGEMAPTLFSIVENKAYTINKLNFPIENTSVPLGFYSDKADGKYKFGIVEIPGVWSVYLEDKMTGNFHDMSLGQYSFDNEINYKTERFVIHFNMYGAPIESTFDPSTKAWRNKEGIEVSFHNMKSKLAKITVTNLAGQVIFVKEKVNTESNYAIPMNDERKLLIVTIHAMDLTESHKVVR